MRIDAHQHFWRPERGDYPWMDCAPSVLRRPFMPSDLEPLLKAARIDATVLVQAAPTVDETQYLLGIADATPWVAGVVGWINFEDASQRTGLEALAAHPALVGIRPMVQDIEDDDWILHRTIEWAFDALQEMDLCFDALGFPRHARCFLQLCTRHPDLRVVLDHGLKPAIANDGFATWADQIRELARSTNASCKLSGLVTEAGEDWSPARLQPYIEHLLECFGPQRLIWGSDWPVASSALAYGEWLRICEQALTQLTDDQRSAVFGRNAIEMYRIDERRT
jgi:L-fuconolactonase